MGPGRVWQAGFSDDGSWVQAQLVTQDRNGNGKLDLPTIKTTLDDDPGGQPSSYSTHGLEKGHDEITAMAIPVAGGRARLAATVQGTLEGDLILTRLDGSLVRASYWSTPRTKPTSSWFPAFGAMVAGSLRRNQRTFQVVEPPAGISA